VDRFVENSNLRAQLPSGNWPDNQRDIGTVDLQSLDLPIEGQSSHRTGAMIECW
jgi:hypothetical protein